MIEMRLLYLSNFETIWQQQYFHADFNDLLYTSKSSLSLEPIRKAL